MNQAEKEEYLRAYSMLKAKGKPFYPYAVAKDSMMAAIVVILIAALLPSSVLAFVVESRTWCVWLLALAYVIGTAYLAPSIAAIQRLVLPEQRATASAIFLFFNATLGAVGPFLTGVISDSLTAELGPQAVGRALLILVPIMQLAAVGCYALAAQHYRRDVIEER